MFLHSYQTTPCAAYNLSKTISAVQRVAIAGDLMTVTDLASGTFKEGTLSQLYAVTPKNSEIPPFEHPLVVTDHHGQGEKPIIVLDLRPHTRQQRDGSIVAATRSGMDFDVLRGALQRDWMNLTPSDFLALGDFPITVYTRWVADNVTRRLGLDAASQVDLTVLTGYFFLWLFRDEKDGIDNSEKVKLATRVARSTYIPVEKCLEIIEPLEVALVDAGTFVETAKEVVLSARMNQFSLGLLYSILSGGWFGANAHSVLAVALEHPPTFYALIYTALNDRSYRRSLFARLVEQLDKRDAGKTFSYNLARMIAA